MKVVGSQYEVGFSTPSSIDITKSTCVKPGGFEPVWCPTTELGNFIARRGGTTFITGNSETDTCVTYLLDKDIARIFKDYKEIIPRWFMEAVVEK